MAVAGMLASTANAAPPPDGTWLYQSNYGGKRPPNDIRLMRVYVEIEEGKAANLNVSGNTGAKCSKFPDRTMPISYTVRKPRIVIRSDGTFSSKWMMVTPSGKIKLRGSINKARIKGTLSLTMTGIKALGTCSTTHSFSVKTQASSDY